MPQNQPNHRPAAQSPAPTVPTVAVPPTSQHQVYGAVRAVGTFRPKFAPNQGRVFSDELNIIGTAFWLKEQKVLVTCAHVIQGMIGGSLELSGLLVVGNAGNYRRAVIDSIDLAHDLAVLKLLNEQNLPISGQELDNEANTGLDIIEEYKPISTPVSYVGFPLGNQLLNEIHSPTYSEGVVGIEKKSGPLRKEIQISGPVVGGFSGSPVVDIESQKLLGVVSNGPTQAGNIFMAISWEHVKAIAALTRS